MKLFNKLLRLMLNLTKVNPGLQMRSGVIFLVLNPLNNGSVMTINLSLLSQRRPLLLVLHSLLVHNLMILS